MLSANLSSHTYAIPAKVGSQKVICNLDADPKFQRPALKEINVKNINYGLYRHSFNCKMGQVCIISFTRKSSWV